MTTTRKIEPSREISPGVFVFRSSVWQMSSGLVLPTGQGPRRGDSALPALLVDPGVSAEEVEGIASTLELIGAEARTIVLTHAHWDHVSGASRFGDTSVVASACYPAEAEAASAEIHREIARCDRSVSPPRCAPFRIPDASSLIGSESEIVGAPRPARALPAPGHTRDGVAMLLPGDGILFAGDYLSAIEIPYVEHSLTAYAQTLACFRRMIRTGRVRTVVPGHGPHLSASDSLRILEEDAAYLGRLLEAALTAAASGASGDQLVEAALDVTLPRAKSDPETLEGHRRNARLAVLPASSPSP